MITKDMNIVEVVSAHPEVISVFRRYGMGCVGCQAARFEDIDQGAQVHGLDVDQLVADLNAALES